MTVIPFLAGRRPPSTPNPSTAPMRNEHLSFSRLQRFERCGLAYKLHYLDHRAAEPGPALRFGKLIHATLETLLREAVDEERAGPLSIDRALAIYQQAWAAEGMTGVELYQEGVEILRTFVREEGPVEPMNVLGIEKEFRLPIGRFTVLGFLDRVDRVDDKTVRIVDYKTNRALFSREEVEGSLQMSLYHLAAQQLWPWAKRVELVFRMLRHGVCQETARTPEQIEATKGYVSAVGERMETATDFPARLNTDCVWCDHKSHCPAFAEALASTPAAVAVNPDDLEAVAREREDLARRIKIMKQRQDELEKVLQVHLEDRDELVLAGTRYRWFKVTRTEYPLDATVKLLAQATGQAPDALLARLAVIDNKAVEGLLKELADTQGRSRASLLKAELGAVARETHSRRFWAKEAP